MESTSADTGSTTGTGSTTYDDPLACAGSDACAPGFCVAPYEVGNGGPGDAQCVDACVPELALDRWCIDDAACCEGLVCGSLDGLCVREGDSADTSSGETWVTLGTSEDSGSSTDGSTSESTGDSTGDSFGSTTDGTESTSSSTG
jgi:hypothetical protein